MGKPRSPDQLSASPHATRYHTRPYRDPQGPKKTVKSPLGCLDVLGAVFWLGPSRVTPRFTHDHDQDHHHYDDGGDDDDDKDDDDIMMKTMTMTTMMIR